jgi:hypothetical protein
MYFDIQREGRPVPAGQWSYPAFILHNSSSTPAADAVVKWRAEISGIKELAKTGVLSNYEILFEDYAFMLISKGGTGVPNFKYYYTNDILEDRLAFIAKDSEIYLPANISSILGLFVVARMPDQLGAKTEAFPVWFSVSWNVPYGGKGKEFRAKIRGVNSKPSGLSGGPEVIGYLEFEVEEIK